MVTADPRKISAGGSSVGSSSATYRRKIPNPPNKADIVVNAHRAGAEFNMLRPPDQSLPGGFDQCSLKPSRKFKVKRSSNSSGRANHGFALPGGNATK